MQLLTLLQEQYDLLRANLLCGYLASLPHEFRLHAVRNGEQLEQACRLLYRQYRRRGYCPANSLGLHFSPYMFAEESRTFVLRQNNQLCGTISVFPDSAAGVPCESLFPQEIENLRKQGIKFAEVGLLATKLSNMTIRGYTLTSTQKMLPVFSLFKIMVNFALDRGITHLVITIHPKHALLYRFFGFRQFSEIKSYGKVCGKPALPMIFDLKASTHSGGRMQRKFFYTNRYSKLHYDSQLSREPDAFARLFGESYHSFQEKYSGVVLEQESKLTSSQGNTIVF
jgi:hypothetical protein